MFSSLPDELVVKILDTLASSDRESCLSLCLVSSWARRIALPHLLHTVIVTERNCTAFSEGVVNGQCSSYVKRLWIGTESSGAESILTYCIFITALTASPSLITPSDKSPPFQSLTHLCITHYPLSQDAVFIIRTFPSLTHFAGIVYSVHDLGFHRSLLGVYGAQLVMVVARMYDLWDDDAVEWVSEVRKEEKRMYMMSLNTFGLEKDWMEDANGVDSVWDRARRETRGALGLDASDDS